MGWQIAMNVKIGFKPHVTAAPGFHTLYDWCYQTMWVFSGVPGNTEDEIGMEMDGADAMYCTVKSIMHPIRTEDEQANQDPVHRMIQIAKPWTIRRCSELRLANRTPLVRIPMENANLIDLE